MISGRSQAGARDVVRVCVWEFRNVIFKTNTTKRSSFDWPKFERITCQKQRNGRQRVTILRYFNFRSLRSLFIPSLNSTLHLNNENGKNASEGN